MILYILVIHHVYWYLKFVISFRDDELNISVENIPDDKLSISVENLPEFFKHNIEISTE